MLQFIKWLLECGDIISTLYNCKKMTKKDIHLSTQIFQMGSGQVNQK